MLWIRNGVVYFLSVILFLCLLAGAAATSINIAGAHPDKIESWLSQSGLYTSIVNTAIKQAQTSTNSNGNSGVLLSDPAVQQAAKTAFTTDLLRTSVNTIINSNYAWLEGKTAKPLFSVDLTTAKQTFAQLIGDSVTKRLASLPVCTLAQAVSLKNYDPLTVFCRPAILDPTTAGTTVTNQILTSDGFLSNPVITADTIDPNTGTNGSEAYYVRFSYAPKVYQSATKLPFAIGALGLLCAVGVIFISARKRKGLHRVGLVLTYAGIILITTRFVSDYVLKQIEKQVFNNSSTGDLQQSLTAFAHLVENQLVKINMYFGIAYLALAALIFITLMIVKGNKVKTPQTVKSSDNSQAPAEPPASSTDSVTATTTNPATPVYKSPTKPKSNKPRLIQ